MGRSMPRPFTLHWGSGQITEEAPGVSPYQGPRIQLLKFEDGSRAPRFCSHNYRGQFQRMPLILEEESAASMRESVAACSEIRELWALLGAGN